MVTPPGPRDPQAGQDHARWLGWMEASTYSTHPDDCDGMEEAFTAGMRVARDDDAATLAAEVRAGHVRIETGGVTPRQAAGIPDVYARHVRAAWPAELTDFAGAEIAGRWEHMTSPRERKFWAEVDAALVAGDRIVRDVLESLCRRDGLSLESTVVPGEPARNYALAERLGIGHVFGLPDEPQTAPGPSERDLADALDSFYGWFTVVGGGARVQGQLQGADAVDFARALHAQLSANRAHRDKP